MKFLSLFLLAGTLFLYEPSGAQSFLLNKSDEPLTFPAMQRMFDEWSQSVDLSKERGWKYFKRWEADMQLHTDGQGNPGDPSLYVEAVTNAAAEKAQAQSSPRFLSTGWVPVGPNVLPQNQTSMKNGIGRINCIAFHPTDPNTYFVGVAQGGMWKTTNNGVNWTPMTDNLPITRISDIAIDPVNPDIMYVSVCDFEYIGFGLKLNGRKRNTHYGIGVYKTSDGGITWQPSGLSFQLTEGDASLIRKIVIHPTNTNKLVACGISGMYTSMNGGTTWTKVLDSLFWDMQADPFNPDILYAATGWVATANDGYAAIYKSTDFGNTWTKLNTGITPTGVVQRIKLAIAPTNPQYVYAITVNTGGGMEGLYKSVNGGLNWQKLNLSVNILDWDIGSSNGGQGNYDLGFLVDAADKDVLYVGGINLWKSADGGLSFSPVSHWTLQYGSSTVHADIHYLAQQSLTGNYFVCCDGGIYRASSIISQSWADANAGTPWPTEWFDLNSGMQVTSFYRVSSSQNSTGRLIAGAQDNASMYTADGTSWSTVYGGDGMDNYLHPQNDSFIIASSQYGSFGYSTDGGATFSNLMANPNKEAAEWTTPIVADYNKPGTLYIGFSNVTKSTDYGMTWNKISSFAKPPSGDNEISALAVSSVNSSVLYATKRVRYEYNIPGKVYRTANGGGSWSNITNGLPDSLYYTSIEADRADVNTAYVSLAGFAAGYKVYRTTNGGSTWQNISYNLPNIPVNCVKQIPGNGTLIAATDIGVYLLGKGSTTWVSRSEGLPNVIVSDIEFNVPLNKIYVSTFGRGIWETDLDAITAVPPVNASALEAELYPSVNSGSFFIRTPVNITEPLTLDIIDVKGALVYHTILSGSHLYPVQLTLPPGMFFARLKGDALIGVKKFMVEH